MSEERSSGRGPGMIIVTILVGIVLLVSCVGGGAFALFVLARKRMEEQREMMIAAEREMMTAMMEAEREVLVAKLEALRAERERAIEEEAAPDRIAATEAELVAAALRVLESCERRHDEDPDDLDARARLFGAAMEVGNTCLEIGDLGTARRGFERALGLGVDDATARAGLMRVEAAEAEAQDG